MSDQPSTTELDRPQPTGPPALSRLAVVRRRAVLRAAGVLGASAVGTGVLAACGSSSSPSSGSGAAAAPSTTATAGSSSGSAAGGGTSFTASDVPVGGGVINADARLVVTQPTSGTFKAFDATCTHMQCLVTRVEQGHIVCMCHGSQYDLTSGAPTKGPASKPLTAKTATANGGTVVVS